MMRVSLLIIFTLLIVSTSSCAVNVFEPQKPRVAYIQKISEGWYQAKIRYTILTSWVPWGHGGDLPPMRKNGVFYYAFPYHPDMSKVVRIPVSDIFRNSRGDDGIVSSLMRQGDESDASFIGKNMNQELMYKTDRSIMGDGATWYWGGKSNDSKYIEIDLKNKILWIKLNSRGGKYQDYKIEGDF